MMRRSAITVVAALATTPPGAFAASPDLSGLSKSDLIARLTAICDNGKSKLSACRAAYATTSAADPTKPKGATGNASATVLAATQKGPELPTLSYALKDKLPFGCKPTDKALFVRSDALDNFNYTLNLLPTPSTGPLASQDVVASPNSISKGLSINFTDNRQSNSQSASIAGRMSYLLFGMQQCSNGSAMALDPAGQPIQVGGNTTVPFVTGFGFAPFIDSNGTWNEPVTTTTTSATASNKRTVASTTTTRSANGLTTTTIIPTKTGQVTTITKKYALSALSFGADFQFYVPSFNLPIQQNFFYVSPYYQTDYLNEANITGVNVAWEPVVRHILNDGIINSYAYFYTGFRPEADFSNVSNPGLTLQTKGEHAWLGETLRPNLTLFPLIDAPTSDNDWFTTWVRGRLALIGTQKYFWDAATKQPAQFYQAIVQYKLGACTVDPTGVKGGGPCAISGSSAISFEYDWGTDINTLIKQNMWKVALNFSY
jgi:hypothetical protein